MNTVADLFSVENFNDILKTTKAVRSKLTAMGLFSQVNMLVDTLPDHPHHYQVKITVQENHCKPFLNMGLVSPQGNVGAGVVRAGVSNMAGGGESLGVELMRGAGSYRKVSRHDYNIHHS